MLNIISIKLVSLYSTIKIMHGPINIRYEKRFEDCMRKTGSQTPLGKDSRRRAILQWIVRRGGKKSVNGLDSWQDPVAESCEIVSPSKELRNILR